MSELGWFALALAGGFVALKVLEVKDSYAGFNAGPSFLPNQTRQVRNQNSTNTPMGKGGGATVDRNGDIKTGAAIGSGIGTAVAGPVGGYFGGVAGTGLGALAGGIINGFSTWDAPTVIRQQLGAPVTDDTLKGIESVVSGSHINF